MGIRPFVTVDVFTDRAFGGNPLAVVLEADGLEPAQMQAIASEFNYAETTFVCAPRSPAHTAQVRIFTPRREIPFAGHPNVGTAWVLARELAARGAPVPEVFEFEETAGLVPVRMIRQADGIELAELRAPEALSVGAAVSAADAAECLSLAEADVRATVHPPHVASVGLPFLIVELASRASLARAKPSGAAHERVLPPVGTDAVFAYVRGESPGMLYARMFSPLDGIIEDPATGSATAATIALLDSLTPANVAGRVWRVEQGAEMGRPSTLHGRTEKRGGRVIGTYVAGSAVRVMRGDIEIPPPRR